MKKAWRVEVEHVSPERKQKTGLGVIRNGRGKFVCKASLPDARTIVRAVNRDRCTRVRS